ncbi:MAG: TraI domain-containing protein [gamma proteobacterium symbiont of Bathyaustriella thionipta]|nr:TraI domain-containing protein [gamma proteobacterium symbiont of Bathyaustriella thionipta]
MSDLSRLPHTQTYQVLHPARKTSRLGKDYLAFRISDGEHCFRAQAWVGEYVGPEQLLHGQQVHIRGQWVSFHHRPILRCRSIAPTQAAPLALEKARTRIRAMLLRLSHPWLQQFVANVFADAEVLQSFLSIPASRHHHHAYPGGLFIHSVDAAWKVFRNPALTESEKPVAVVAALLHDIGKVSTHTRSGEYTATGYYVDHEALTLTVLDEALGRLDEQDPRTALLLRHHLTWSPRKQPIPRAIGAAWVRTADQASAAGEMRRLF